MPEYKQTYDSKRVITAAEGSMRVFNRIVARLTKLGVSLMGSRVLSVRGRKSGEWRSTPVNLLVLDGERYLVAPRGHTQWVKNLRATNEARLQLGRKVETFRAEEIADADKTRCSGSTSRSGPGKSAPSSAATSTRTPPTRSSTTSPPASPSSESTPSVTRRTC